MQNALDFCTFAGKAIWGFEMSILPKINQLIMGAFITNNEAGEEEENGTSSGRKRKTPTPISYEGVFHVHLLEVFDLFKNVHDEPGVKNRLLSDSANTRRKGILFDAKEVNGVIEELTGNYAKDASDCLKR